MVHGLDIVQHSFGGSLRSVLICETCGYKRAQPGPFLNISLPVAKELVSMNETGNINSKGVTTTTHSVSTRRNIASKTKINLQACLNQFTSPEPLGDPVHCPICQVKTNTLKQLTFAKLPKILYLHLKRFDALTNKKLRIQFLFFSNLTWGSICHIGKDFVLIMLFFNFCFRHNNFWKLNINCMLCNTRCEVEQKSR